ncbi:S-adenosylmethionine decarboxylase [Russula earlei]|uniref:S-adenosylmethionine decarboxylase n=1 Tax=Russula earlei TaxID=71964 RepID=A0ACC0U8S1_9AGAM|nr:S-adenosylmethionine decarboxylase [Russula earlei]
MGAMTDVTSTSAPFEGPEKLLEIWFAPSPAETPGASSTIDGKHGLRSVERSVWEDMLAIVKCQVLSVVEGTEMDAYLLSESSLFVSPHRLILKTCGTTLNLLGLPRILEIARDHASLPTVHRCFYSRKSFFFPDRQMGPHRGWKDEVEYLDKIFRNGSAYSVGKMNGDHWLLYITRPLECARTLSPIIPSRGPCGVQLNGAQAHGPSDVDGATVTPKPSGTDFTIEILMTRLSPAVSRAFYFPEERGLGDTPSGRAHKVSSDLGITDIFPPQLTTLDSYAFSPCGYSANALLKWGQAGPSARAEDHDPGYGGEGYYTIHVTPEEDWSYASFECNVPLSPVPAPHSRDIPDLGTLVRRVVDIFRPGRLTLTLFISSTGNDEAEEEDGESAIEAAQRAFKVALTNKSSLQGFAENGRDNVYTRTDKIDYDFGDYDLAFASFELTAS